MHIAAVAKSFDVQFIGTPSKRMSRALAVRKGVVGLLNRNFIAFERRPSAPGFSRSTVYTMLCKIAQAVEDPKFKNVGHI